jgi:predicted component of type VI protein secretion system
MVQQLLALGGTADPALAQQAGLTRRAIMPAAAMERALSGYFGVAARVEQFVGGWQPLALRDRNALGRRGATLGGDMALGEREWRCDQRVRVHVGPLGESEYRQFLPRGAGAAALARMVGGLVGDPAGAGAAGGPCGVEACLHLAAGCVRGARLDGGQQLGYNAFVLTSEKNEPRSELRYQL